MNINCNVPADTLALSPRMLASRQSAKIEVAPAEAAAITATNAPSLDAAAEKVAPFAGPFTNADVQQLTANWGQSNSQYDLDGNGTVDIDDLLLMLSQIQAEPEPTPAGPAAEIAMALTARDPVATTPPVATTDPASAASSDPASPESSAPGSPGGSEIERLLAAWGQANSRYDLDGSGVVGIDDLLMMISNWQAPNVIECSPAIVQTAHEDRRDEAFRVAQKKQETDRINDARAQSASDGLGLGVAGVKSLSTSLIGRLVAAGFEERPPTNLREVVDKLGLQPGDQRQVLATLTKRYPNGLGVSLRA